MEEILSPKEKLEKMLLKKLNKLESIKEGSDEHTRLTDDIQKLYKQWNDARKIDNEYELTKERDRREASNKRRQIEMEARRNRRVKPDTILTVAMITGLTIGCCVFEAKGHILPTKALRLVDKVKYTI